MGLTIDFKKTIQKRAQEDPEFREALLKESIECMLAGDTNTGKAMLRDYINATVGFSELAEVVGNSPKSIMRMLSDSGNPRANNLFQIIGHLQKQEGIELRFPRV